MLPGDSQGGNFENINIKKKSKLAKIAPWLSPGSMKSGFWRFRTQIMMYLTFSESFEIIEAIFQKLSPKPFFIFLIFKNCQISLLMGVIVFLDVLIIHQLLVKMFCPIHKNIIEYCKNQKPRFPPILPILRPIFGHFDYFLTPGFWQQL